ncbi:hypothetical protein KRMM14A1259_45700 [Krasilnikovia sp. MM14-A1259]
MHVDSYSLKTWVWTGLAALVNVALLLDVAGVSFRDDPAGSPRCAGALHGRASRSTVHAWCRS